jgi:hypothetical protein
MVCQAITAIAFCDVSPSNQHFDHPLEWRKGALKRLMDWVPTRDAENVKKQPAANIPQEQGAVDFPDHRHSSPPPFYQDWSDVEDNRSIHSATRGSPASLSKGLNDESSSESSLSGVDVNGEEVEPVAISEHDSDEGSSLAPESDWDDNTSEGSSVDS